jgi:hypothetical protein
MIELFSYAILSKVSLASCYLYYFVLKMIHILGRHIGGDLNEKIRRSLDCIYCYNL